MEDQEQMYRLFNNLERFLKMILPSMFVLLPEDFKFLLDRRFYFEQVFFGFPYKLLILQTINEGDK